MDFFTMVLAVSFLTGAGLIVYSMVNFHGGAQREDVPYTQLVDKLDAFDASLSEADSAIAELDGKSRAVFQELDDKYRELLFLYNMIDDKKAAMEDAPRPRARSVRSESARTAKSRLAADSVANPRVDVVVGDRVRRRLQSPRAKQILALAAEGLDVSAIAKKLSIGKGEVSLILELGKDVRRNA